MSLFRCPCTSTTVSTEGIVRPRWILGVSMPSPLLTWLLWPPLKWILKVNSGVISLSHSFCVCVCVLLFLFVFSIFSFLVNWDTVWRANTTAKFHVSTELNSNVGLLRLFPGITAATVSRSAPESHQRCLFFLCHSHLMSKGY